MSRSTDTHFSPEQDVTDIQPGDRVRSFDFALFTPAGFDLKGPQAWYVEGVVEKILSDGMNYDRYKIRVERRVWAGDEIATGPEYVFAPVNGTPVAGSNTLRTNGVRLIERPSRTDAR